MGVGNVLRTLDEAAAEMLGSWNSYSTGLATVLIGMVIYRVVTLRDPDVHPILLARQADHDRIRMPGQSPVYCARYTERLTTGFNVRDPPAPGQRASAWARGRDGDLRDVWRQVLLGKEPVAHLGFPVKGDTEAPRKRGRLLTVLGASVVENDLDAVDRQIKAIGKHLAGKGAKRVAIYLSNSVELVAALFACSFFLQAPILIPFDQPPATLIAMLRDAGADTVIAEPGVLPVDSLVSSLPELKHVVWVTDEGNSHIGWDDVPGNHINVSTWRDVVAAAAAAHPAEGDGGEAAALDDKTAVPPGLVTFWLSRDANGNDSYRLVEFSQANLVAGIAGQLEALMTIGPDDVFMPADALASAHTLVVTLAAMHSNATIALNAATSHDPDLAQLTDSDAPLCPSIIVASPTTLVKAHADYSSRLLGSVVARLAHWSRTRTLVRDGRMPAPASALRYIITADRAGSGATPTLSPSILSNLRVATGARIVYALTSPLVAGAVAQTMPFDYRVSAGLHGTDAAEPDAKPHFGGPPRCLRYVLKDSAGVKNSVAFDTNQYIRFSNFLLSLLLNIFTLFSTT
jgi:hypothetical protein